MIVLKSRFDQAVREAQAANDRADMALAQMERLSSLLRFALKPRKKKSAERAPSQFVAQEPTLHPQVAFAIEQMATGDAGLRRYLNRFAQEQTALKKDPQDIIKAIREGDGQDSED